MAASEMAGYVGATLAGAAYVPQIRHMVVERCVAGISLPAYAVWFLASALITASAIAAGVAVFIALGALQTSATAFIVGYVTMHQGCYCDTHRQHA